MVVECSDFAQQTAQAFSTLLDGSLVLGALIFACGFVCGSLDRWIDKWAYRRRVDACESRSADKGR